MLPMGHEIPCTFLSHTYIARVTCTDIERSFYRHRMKRENKTHLASRHISVFDYAAAMAEAASFFSRPLLSCRSTMAGRASTVDEAPYCADGQITYHGDALVAPSSLVSFTAITSGHERRRRRRRYRRQHAATPPLPSKRAMKMRLGRFQDRFSRADAMRRAILPICAASARSHGSHIHFRPLHTAMPAKRRHRRRRYFRLSHTDCRLRYLFSIRAHTAPLRATPAATADGRGLLAAYHCWSPRFSLLTCHHYTRPHAAQPALIRRKGAHKRREEEAPSISMRKFHRPAPQY